MIGVHDLVGEDEIGVIQPLPLDIGRNGGIVDHFDQGALSCFTNMAMATGGRERRSCQASGAGHPHDNLMTMSNEHMIVPT
nr:hypothetical protein CFP56_52187 [Quercus suber]